MFESAGGVEVVVVPGAASSGLTWRRVGERLPIRVLPAPDAPTVEAMACDLVDRHGDLREPRPRVLVGASLGGMVAVELARTVPHDALVLAATGPGIYVAPTLLDWVASADRVLAKIARMSLADPEDAETLALAVEDLVTRGRDVLHRHLSALGAYEFRPPPTAAIMPTVLWGVADRSVPREDHVRLAERLGGVVVPVTGAGHLPFHERAERVADQLRDTVGAIDQARKLRSS